MDKKKIKLEGGSYPPWAYAASVPACGAVLVDWMEEPIELLKEKKKKWAFA